MAGIFISYRRDDAQGEALHLFDNLKQHFGADRVFMDVIAIRPGEDFRKVIDSAVASCDVLVTLIGREWLTSTTAAGQPRISDVRDFVRLETAAALKRDVRVIPVLVQGAAMPTEDVLPDELKSLAYRNAVELSHRRWDYDVRMLIEALERVLPPTAGVAGLPPSTTPPSTARRPVARMVAAAGAVAVLLIGGAGYWFWPRSVTPPPKPSVTTAMEPTAPTPAPVPPAPAPGDPAPSPPRSKPAPAPEAPDPAAPRSKPAPAPEARDPAPPPSPPKPKAPVSISVPTLVGLKEADASAALERAGLVMGKRANVKRGDVEPGTVLAQTPGPGESVEKGRNVAIDVAVADLRSVPDLIGKSTREASQALQQEELKWVFRREATDEAKANTVLRQQPAVGTQVKPGTTVDVTVAVPATVEVPKLTGLTRSDALFTLERASLRSRVSERPAAGEKPDMVIGQDPAAGTRVSPGTTVTLTFSVPVDIEVPRVTGLTRAEASDRLSKANLGWRWETTPNRQYKPGIVVAQKPEPGARVAAKFTVVLTVAVSPEGPAPGTCIPGYVWREAFPSDRVCVEPKIRDEAAQDNKYAASRLERDPSKRAYGPDTCAQGYVWREASPTDHVCVKPSVRTRTAEDNRAAPSRVAR